MGKIEIRKVHYTTIDEAINKAKSYLESFKEKHKSLITEIKWTQNDRKVEISGPMFKGYFIISEEMIKGEIFLSLLASPFKSKVEEKLTKKLNEIFPASEKKS